MPILVISTEPSIRGIVARAQDARTTFCDKLEGAAPLRKAVDDLIAISAEMPEDV